MASSFGAFINIEDGPKITDPPAVVHKDNLAVSSVPNAYELDQLSWGNRYNGPTTDQPALYTPSGARTPNTPNEHNTSISQGHISQPVVDVTQSLTNPSMNRWRFLCACIMSFTSGMNDSAPGALIPYMEKEFDIGYAVVSLIFVSQAVGFISAAPFTHALQARFGRAKCLVFAEMLLLLAYIMLVTPSPYPVVVISFFFSGLGMAWILALNNFFVANLAGSATLLGFFHGAYGIGGTIGPLIATGLVSNGRRWSTFYCIPLANVVVNIFFAFWSFRNYETDSASPLITALERQVSQESNQPPSPPSNGPKASTSTLRDALRNKTTLLGALFIFAYQGAEVSISGWVISFLLTYRNPSESSRISIGYVTAGFWAGITIGRFVLSHPCHKLGEKLAVFLLVLGAAACQLLVWLIPNIIGEAVAVSIVGLLLGPVYPCATVVFSRLLDRKLQMSSLSFIAAMGSSGGAVAPFMTGLTAQKAGTWVLHPICISLFGVMAACWAGLDKMEKRME